MLVFDVSFLKQSIVPILAFLVFHLFVRVFAYSIIIK